MIHFKIETWTIQYTNVNWNIKNSTSSAYFVLYLLIVDIIKWSFMEVIIKGVLDKMSWEVLFDLKFNSKSSCYVWVGILLKYIGRWDVILLQIFLRKVIYWFFFLTLKWNLINPKKCINFPTLRWRKIKVKYNFSS